MANNYLFTSESVSEGHPDKMADAISDAVVDAVLAQDKRARIAVETLVKTGVAIVAGELTTTASVEFEALIRKTILDIGYDSSEMGYDGASVGVINIIGKQSPDIAQGVDRKDEKKQGAGDQGLMFGYATNETDVLMPAPIALAHRLVKKQADVRKKGKLDWLRPDAKSQVTLRYEDDKPVGIEAVWSMEHPLEPLAPEYDAEAGFQCVCPGGKNGVNDCDKKRRIDGSASFVTGAFGLAAAGVVVRALSGRASLG